jgi:hypothetical protein
MMARFFIMNLIINFRKKKFMKMETDKMKKIVFSKLWEYNTYRKVESIYLQNKRFGRVYVNKKNGVVVKEAFKD